MALNTRRMSGMAAQPGGHALLETLDAFRRKHASQNKEIIHRNSDLMRANTDLSNKLRESQNELVALRGDYAALLAASSHLEAKNTSLREQLRTAHDEIRRRNGQAEGTGAADVRMQEERFQALRITLDKVVAQLQGAQAICLLTASDHQNAPKYYSPVSPPQSPPFTTLPTSFEATRQASSGSTASSSSLQRRTSTQALVSAQPELSYISEGSQEPSFSLSQQEYRPYSSSGDEEDMDQPISFNIPEEAGATNYEHQYASYGHHAPFIQNTRQDILAASYASSVEPDYVGEEVERNLLSASPKRLPSSQVFSITSSPLCDDNFGRSASTSPSPMPTPSMPPFPSFPEVPRITAAFSNCEAQGCDSNTEPLLGDDRGDTLLKHNETKRRNARPSLLAQLGVSPGQLDLNFGKTHLSADSGMTNSNKRTCRSRSISPSPLVNQAVSEDEDSDSPKVATSSTDSMRQHKTASSSDPDGLYLSKTVRHSNSATTLREKAKAAAAVGASTSDLPPVDASPANRVIARRRSNPTLSSKLDLSGSGKPFVDQPSSRGKTDKKRASTSSLESAKSRSGSKIVQSMQPRPSSVPLVALDGKASSSSSTSAPTLGKTSGVTISRPRSGSAVHRKLPSVSPTSTKNIVNLEVEQSPVTVVVSKHSDSSAPAIASSNVTARAGSRLTRSRSTSPEVEMNMSNKTSVLSDITGLGLPQASTSKASLSPSRAKDKGKRKEISPAASYTSRRDRESSPLTPYDSQDSALSLQNDTSVESMSAANISAREGRRARANVSYQEPSLNKKMRQPAGYVASIKSTSSKHSGPGLGVRRKSSLQLGGEQTSSRKSTSPAPTNLDETGMRENEYDDLSACDVEASETCA